VAQRVVTEVSKREDINEKEKKKRIAQLPSSDPSNMHTYYCITSIIIIISFSSVHRRCSDILHQDYNLRCANVRVFMPIATRSPEPVGFQRDRHAQPQ
jgi:hypothetical protein